MSFYFFNLFLLQMLLQIGYCILFLLVQKGLDIFDEKVSHLLNPGKISSIRMYVCMDVYRDKRKDENEWMDELQLVKY